MPQESSHPLNVLVVEDDPGVAALLRRSLSFEGYKVSLLGSGTEAMDAVNADRPDLVILDLMIPGIDGMEVARRIRAAESVSGLPSVPILMLTARDTIADRVRGLDAGADDYLVKPFSLDELLARVRALLRRVQGTDEQGRTKPMSYQDVSMDAASRTVLRGNRELRLTPKEYDLLELFLRNPNIVLSRNQIMERVWGQDSWGDSNVLEVFIGNLRREMEADGEPRLIQTVRGIGYSLRRVSDR